MLSLSSLTNPTVRCVNAGLATLVRRSLSCAVMVSGAFDIVTFRSVGMAPYMLSTGPA